MTDSRSKIKNTPLYRTGYSSGWNDAQKLFEQRIEPLRKVSKKYRNNDVVSEHEVLFGVWQAINQVLGEKARGD